MPYQLLKTLFLVLLSAPALADNPVDWKLLVPGDYHGEEAPQHPGKNWLALSEREGIWQLLPAAVTSTPINDGVLDLEGEKSGVRISAKPKDALVVLRIPGLRTGAVDTPALSFSSEAPLLITAVTPVHFLFGGAPFTLQVRNHKVYLQNSRNSTLLAEQYVGNADSDDAATLLWAGDLNRDGKPDLLVRAGTNNGTNTCLYLSDPSTPNQLVRKVACHQGVGC